MKKKLPSVPRASANPQCGALAVTAGSASYVRIWNLDDDGESHVHLISDGNDFTVCGHDIAGDDDIHLKPPQELPGRHRVTCPLCLNTIETVRGHLRWPNNDSGKIGG